MMIIWDKCGHGYCERKNCDENVNDHVEQKMRTQKQVPWEAICALAGIYDCCLYLTLLSSRQSSLMNNNGKPVSLIKQCICITCHDAERCRSASKHHQTTAVGLEWQVHVQAVLAVNPASLPAGEQSWQTKLPPPRHGHGLTTVVQYPTGNLAFMYFLILPLW